ncbi:DUF3696 domain-containing protein [Pantoea stewartii]|uniref:DUF3696 domain-containing protein n=1 Tax=Pantoea stewartii TaxID=66269 RepID=UPI0019810B84|nr:DUF3696 domain-containing protein [Pantoea stewartii]
MINNISIHNFKSLKTLEPIAMGSCLFLCGPNSSGKSSFIQVVLLIAQNIANDFKGGMVSLNGNLVKLGEFDNILSHSNDAKEIKISFDLFPENDIKKSDNVHKVSFGLSFGIRESDGEKRRINPELSRVEVDVFNKDSDSHDLIRRLSLEVNQSSLMNLDLCIEDQEELDQVYPEFKILEFCKFDGCIPTTIKLVYNVSKKISQDIIPLIVNEQKYLFKKSTFKDVEKRALTNITIPEEFSIKICEIIKNKLNDLNNGLNIPSEEFNERFIGLESVLINKLESLKENFIAINFKLKQSDIPEHFLKTKTHIREWQYFISNLEYDKRQQLIVLLDENRSLLQEIWLQHSKKITSEIEYEMPIFSQLKKMLHNQFSTNIKYLGPLRKGPVPFYETNPYNGETVGLKGEYTAALLYNKKDEIITYLSPELYNNEQYIKFVEKKETLHNACISWLTYLGVITDIEVGDIGELGLNIKVKNTNDKQLQGLSHVGVGVSQVLPIIVMLLLSKRNDTLIFEQPELHLHPKIQSRLCDLIIASSTSERQCIVETHSEYIINRLRLRIAQSSDPEMTKNNILYFVNKVESNSFFEKVDINRFGAIPNWPEGFFDQTDKEIEKILIAANNKSKKERISEEDKNADY